MLWPNEIILVLGADEFRWEGFGRRLQVVARGLEAHALLPDDRF